MSMQNTFDKLTEIELLLSAHKVIRGQDRDESRVDGHPAGYKRDVRAFEHAGSGLTRTRFKPRTTDHYYQCTHGECRFWCVSDDKASHHASRKQHSVSRVELGEYESLPSRHARVS
jgi:hypothetical protein